MTFEAQVQAVRRRMVVQQVRLLRMSAIWAAMNEDVAADCVLAAGGDIVVAHRLLLRYFEEHHGPRTPDMTAEDEQSIVHYIRQQAAGFSCDCSACTGSTHASRFQHERH